MIRHDDTDRVLEEWFAEGPSRMSDRLVAATLDQLDHTPQPRVRLPWSPTMNRLITYGAGLAAVLVVSVVAWAALGGLGGFGSQPTPSPTPIPTETFTSTRHAYTVRMPRGSWTHAERAGTWALGDFLDGESPGVDYYARRNPDLGAPLNLYLSSQPIPAGMSVDDWMATHDEATGLEHPCFSVLATYQNVTVDGEPARQLAQHCEDFFGSGDDGALTGIQTLVAHNGRGYAIYLWPENTGIAMPPLETLQAEAQAWLSTFTFGG